jgi:hypothetical protein
LRNPLRVDGLGCLRTRAMNPRPLVPETSAPPSLPRFLSGLCLPRTPVGATARMNLKYKLKNPCSKAKRKGA